MRRLVGRIVVYDDQSARATWVEDTRTVTLSAHGLRPGSPVRPDLSAAATLVHECMHARLRELGISRYKDEKERLREELLCNRASLVFARFLESASRRGVALPEPAASARSLIESLEHAQKEWSAEIFTDARRREALLVDFERTVERGWSEEKQGRVSRGAARVVLRALAWLMGRYGPKESRERIERALLKKLAALQPGRRTG